MATTILPPAGAGASSTRARPFASFGYVLVCGALLDLCYLTVALRRQVDPIENPVSDDVFYQHGDVLFVMGILLVLLGGLLIALAMASAGVTPTPATKVLFGLWAAGLVVVAAFRGNDNAQQPTWHGELHRLGGAVFFTCLPLACRTLARTLATRQRWTALARRLGWLTVIGIATAAAFGVAQVVPALPEGLLERIALGGELALLLTLASGMRRAAR